MSPKRDLNYLPRHVASGFQSELINLVYTIREDAYLRYLGGSNSRYFKEDYLAKEFLSKYCDSSTVSPELRRRKAIEKWLSTEEKNHDTNFRLAFDQFESELGYTSEEYFAFMRTNISKILGSADLVVERLKSSHTNGASTHVSRSEIAALLKHADQARCSEGALPFWIATSSGTVLNSTGHVDVVNASSLFTVPKKTDIDRVACKEPSANLYLQRGAGNHIRSRLRRFGIDLNDQTINQRMAKAAVQTGHATVDLSAASDSISRQLVAECLPPDWFCFLNAIRVHQASIDGQAHELEMFSSMGNGFTFELESLLFWLTCRFICMKAGIKGRISVYGDDIILPSAAYEPLVELFDWIGFKVNPDKSFASGPFRESCGEHYYLSQRVTPFYIREPVRRMTDIIRLLNRLFEWDTHQGCFLTEKVAVFHKKWAAVVPRKVWGGQDPSSITSLVTGHQPRERFIQRPISRRFAKCGRRLRRDWSLESSAFALWLTQKRLTSETLVVDPSVQGRWDLSPQPKTEKLGHYAYDALPPSSRALYHRPEWNPYCYFPNIRCISLDP